MRGITFATFVVLLLVTSGMIGNEHIALAHSSKVIGTFTNSGNNQETQQSCGNSCTMSSSNVITQGAASTTPSPSPTFGTILDLGVQLTQKELAGVLLFQDTGRPVVVNVPLTITITGTGVPHNLVTTIPATESAFFSVPFEPPTNPGTYTVQAHFAGSQLPSGTLSPSDSGIQMFTVP